MRRSLVVAAVVGALGLTACGSDAGDDSGPIDNDTASPDDPARDEAAVRERISTIQDAVTDWGEASTVQEAHWAAEAATNLIVGPNGPGYGDRDGDGVVQGESEIGLLPGLGADPTGLAVSLASNECVTDDVLGPTADDPAAGWAEMEAAIEAWRPDDNTMPSLASHPMRVVGWATFTFDSNDLDEAHEYAGHAQLHVDVTRNALDCT